jgi:hypothetical protein
MAYDPRFGKEMTNREIKEQQQLENWLDENKEFKNAYKQRLTQSRTPYVTDTPAYINRQQSSMALQAESRSLNIPIPEPKNYEKLQTLRSTPLKPLKNKLEQEFQCTRHATSCNNIKMGESGLGRDDNPALSIYGIEETIILAGKEGGSERFKMPRTPKGELVPIAVSGLIRTWETAVLLYGYQPELPKNQKEGYIDIKLRICPWLRETSSSFFDIEDVGNKPQELKHSIPKFIKFLNKLAESTSVDIDDEYGVMGSYNLGNTYRIGTVTIYIPPADTPKNKFPSNGTWQEIIISLDRNTQLYKHTNLCPKTSKNPNGIIDTVYDRPGYQNEVGNIMEFMGWYTTIFPNIITPIVHIVAHSQIMQAFAKTRKKLDKSTTEQNCWTMNITYTLGDGTEPPKGEITSIQDGYPKPTDEITVENNEGESTTLKKMAKKKEKLEQGERGTSLCGKYGNLIREITCASGGRRTRRKRSNRKKTRRHRRYSRHRR